MINATFFLSLFLLIWFKTDAFSEYGKILSLNKLWNRDPFRFNSYWQTQHDGANLSYPDYLVTFHNNFITRLISCPICLSVWAGFFLAPTFMAWGTVTILSLFIFKLLDKLF